MDLSSLLDRMQDALFLIQPHGEILYVSSYTKKLLGFEADELLGMKIYDIFEEKTREKFHFHLQSLLKKQRLRALESCEQIFYGQCQRKDQSTIWVEVKGQAWQKGDKVEFVMVMREMVHGAFYQRMFLQEEKHKDLQSHTEEVKLRQEFSEMKNTYSEPDKVSIDQRQSQMRGRTEQKDSDLRSLETLVAQECLALQDSLPSPTVTTDVSRLEDVQAFGGFRKSHPYRLPARKGLPLPYIPKEAFANFGKSSNPDDLKSDSLQTKPSSSAQDFTPVSRKRLMCKQGDSTALASQAHIKDFSGQPSNLLPMEIRKPPKEAKTTTGRTPLVDEVLLKAKYGLQDTPSISRKRSMSKQEASPSPESRLKECSYHIDYSSQMEERKTAIESESQATRRQSLLINAMLSLKRGFSSPSSTLKLKPPQVKSPSSNKKAAETATDPNI